MGLHKSKIRKTKIGLITSRGGHLFQLYQLKPWWRQHDRFWVTFQGDDTVSLLEAERVYYGFSPESRNPWNAIRNLVLAWVLLLKEKPTVLISCGAGIAPPFFYVGKLLKIKLIFIEPYDFIRYPSLTGRLVAPIVDELLVQHPEQLAFFKNARFEGSIL